jgi:2-polyprenyl-3-methyl-5-hydroxy-6-metoxy-1,4-benzoquinol methylase
MDIGALWSERARRYGRRCVLSLRIPEDQFDVMTQWQAGKLFPLLRKQLAHKSLSVLDYGCGCGRFSSDLLAVTEAGKYVGYDPCLELIEMARLKSNDSRMTFFTGSSGTFFENSFATFDLVWIMSVLGGIEKAELAKTARGIASVIKPGGLLFLAEDTSSGDRTSFWKFRAESEYTALFADCGIALGKVGAYRDAADHDISILAGQKPTV